MSTELIRQKILIIEDDMKMAQGINAAIAPSGFEVKIALSGEEGFFLVYSFRPHLLILDIHLPGRDGLEILKQIREEGHDVRILLLTSHNELEDRVRGLQMGADDYLGKPFAFTELLARVEALLRRGQVATSSTRLRVADMILDVNARSALRAGVDLDLTEREFDLLLYLVENRGRTVSREMLTRDVWHEMSRFAGIDNVIDVQMARLRRKVDDPFDLKLLQTVRGVGFTLREASV